MKRNKFSLSHYKLLSCDMGELVPCGLVEVLPGDTIQHATSMLVRLSPLLAPMMHPVHIRVHHWFVPHRLVWDSWEDFITGGPDGEDDSAFPTIAVGAGGLNPGAGSLVDYLGGPASITAAQTISALPIRGYQLIWNEWYRDQDLSTEAVISTGDGADTLTERTLKNVAWEKDYFTSARPWPQKGPEVTLPLGATAPVIMRETGTSPGVRHASRGSAATTSPINVNEAGTASDGITWETDLSAATAASVNDLREAFALQRYAEARARYGSRYTEYLRYLGIRSSDARLQRPEYLGGGRQLLQVSEVLQTAADATSGTTGSTGVGNLKGHGIGAIRSNRYRKFFEEHGYVFSLLSVKPKTMYANGINRHWLRRTKEDFYQRELEHIGQQEVLKQEVYWNTADVGGTFGYQDRYDDYRRIESGIAGDFRGSLDFWHMARIFASEPALNDTFVKSVPTKRVNAVQTNDVLWIMANHSIQARRMLARMGNSYIY